MNKIRITSFIYILSLMLLVPIETAAQAIIEVAGIVRDEDGESLPGARINIEGSKIYTQSDINGKFRIKGEKGQTIIVHYLGMKASHVKINGPQVVIKMSNNQQLDEAVVTGYQKIKSRVFTGAASSVKMDEIKLNGIGDVSRMLEGQIPGLSIQNVSGSFGASPRINIRGGASILGNTQPLWVIDGVVHEDMVNLSLDDLVSGDAITLIGSAVAGINPSDIEEIQVLKDASATSIYGARALNGVIVVTTRRGKKDSPIQVSYSTEISFRQRPRYREFDLMNSQQTMSLYNEMEDKGYFTIANTLYGRRSGVYYQLYKGQNTINPSTGNYYIPNTEMGKNNFMRSREYANTDWFKYLFTRKPIHSHTISLTGGGENNSIYASLSLYKDLGWTIADNVQRITANLKNTFYIGDDFTATISMQGNIREQKSPGTIAQHKNMILGKFERDFDINPFSYALGTPRTLRPYNESGQLEYYRNNWADFNILNEYDNNFMDTEVLDWNVQADLAYKLKPWLELKGLLSVRNAKTENFHKILEGSNVIGAFQANETPQVIKENIYLLRDFADPSKTPQVALTEGGILNKTNTSMKSYLARFAADVNKNFGIHSLRAFAFTEIRKTDRIVNPFSGYGIQYKHGNQIFTNPLIFDKLSNEGNSYFDLTEFTDRGVTFSGSTTYSYAGKYVANAVFNYEGSNAAGKGARSRWLPTWNIGAKWNAHNEGFLKDYPYISKLAIRTSFGLTAKMNEHAVNSNAVFKNQLINRVDYNDKENSLQIHHLENRDLTWEKMYELNLGFDLGFMKNRFTATIDVYNRSSFDLIDLVRTSGIGGQYYKYANFGDMRTTGAEFSLHSKNIDQRDFSWSTSLNLSIRKQKITRLLNTPNAFDMVSGTGHGNIVGYPRSSLFSFNFQGLNEQGLPTFDFGLYPTQSEFSNITGADFTDTQYTKSYLIYHGSTEPKYMGGLTNTLKYKNFELSFLITMQGGNVIRLNPTFDPSFGDLNVFSKDYKDRWTGAGDEFITNVPTLPSVEIINLYGAENIERAYNTYNYSQMRVADGSFVRMKNISLSYSCPENLLDFLHISGLVIRLNATNPFLIYSDKRLNGQDPEYYKSGGVSLPTPKQYTMTINLSI